MKLYVTSFFMNPRCYLDVNYRVYLTLDSRFNKSLRRFTHSDISELMIVLDFTRKRKTQIAKIQQSGPLNTQKKSIRVFLPYHLIQEKKSEKAKLICFVALACDAILEILAQVDLPVLKLKKLKQDLLDELRKDFLKYKYADEGG